MRIATYWKRLTLLTLLVALVASYLPDPPAATGWAMLGVGVVAGALMCAAAYDTKGAGVVGAMAGAGAVALAWLAASAFREGSWFLGVLVSGFTLVLVVGIALFFRAFRGWSEADGGLSAPGGGWGDLFGE